MTPDNPVELVTVTEAARRMRACVNTLKRKIARHGIVPDALLLEGETKTPSPLFVASRLPQLQKLIA